MIIKFHKKNCLFVMITCKIVLSTASVYTLNQSGLIGIQVADAKHGKRRVSKSGLVLVLIG